MGGACRMHGRNKYNILGGKPERKIPYERPRRRWENNIRMGIREMGWEGVNWMVQIQDRDHRRFLMNTEMNFRVP